MVKLGSRTPEEITEIYDMVQCEITKMLETIQTKSGYYTTGQYSLFEDTPKKCMDLDIHIAMLEKPHEEDEGKLKYYQKENPNNVLNLPITAHKHNSWYMIYDGVHRAGANELNGEKRIKANIIVPYPKK